jgi:hypothetical protein
MTPRRKQASPKAAPVTPTEAPGPRVRLPKARVVEGVDEEIALLRVRSFQYAKEHPEQLELLLKGVTLLVRAVATKYRLSPTSKKDLTESIEGIINGIGRGMGLGEFADETKA